MAFQVSSAWLERMFDGTQALDFDAVAADTFKMGFATDTSFDPDVDVNESNLTPVATATGWTGPVTLTSPTCGLDGSKNLLFDADDPAQVAQDAGGFANGRLVYIKENTNGYIIAAHLEGSAFGNVDGPLNVSWPSGIWKMTI